MSRTHRDKPYKYVRPEEHWDKLCDSAGLRLPGLKTKKRKEVDYKWHWRTTPMCWIHQMMNKPQRRAGRLWERKVVKMEIDGLIDVDLPSVSRKPHEYYW